MKNFRRNLKLTFHEIHRRISKGAREKQTKRQIPEDFLEKSQRLWVPQEYWKEFPKQLLEAFPKKLLKELSRAISEQAEQLLKKMFKEISDEIPNLICQIN